MKDYNYKDTFSVLKNAFKDGLDTDDIVNDLAKMIKDAKVEAEKDKQAILYEQAKDKVRSDTVDQVAGIIGEYFNNFDIEFDAPWLYKQINKILVKIPTCDDALCVDDPPVDPNKTNSIIHTPYHLDFDDYVLKMKDNGWHIDDAKYDESDTGFTYTVSAHK